MKVLFFLGLLCMSICSQAQITQEEYIKIYSGMAVREMHRSGVPASITLAQGILESGSGNSFLATQGNNHFGIKCGGSWDGEYLHWDDDARQECFRKYYDAEESFIDHSDFLVRGARYQFLFELKTTDYKGWCHGLKKAGYATSPTYAQKLIDLIERHKLHEFDYLDDNLIASLTSENADDFTESANSEQSKYQSHTQSENIYDASIYVNTTGVNNNTPYFVANNDTDIRTLAKEIDLMPWQIIRYNDLNKNSRINKGDIIYTKPKRNKADRSYEIHIVNENETMRDISQKYGIKLKKLYKKNGIEFGNEPTVGTKLNLRANVNPTFQLKNNIINP